MLVLKDLSVFYDKFCVLEDISFSLNTGEILAILGPNGSGKTTLLKAIAGIIRFQKGSLEIFGKIPQQLSFRERSICYLPQQHNVNLYLPLKVFDVVAQSFQVQKKWGVSKISPEDKLLIEEALSKVNMLSELDKLFFHLSGGQRQRVLLALALISQPKILLLDEPTNGLDYTSINKIYEVLTQMKDSGVGIVMISHDLASIFSFADKVTILMNRMEYHGSVQNIPEDLMNRIFGVPIMPFLRQVQR